MDIFLGINLWCQIKMAASIYFGHLRDYAGKMSKNKAEIAGGIILILIGIKILLEHLGVINF